MAARTYQVARKLSGIGNSQKSETVYRSLLRNCNAEEGWSRVFFAALAVPLALVITPLTASAEEPDDAVVTEQLAGAAVATDDTAAAVASSTTTTTGSDGVTPGTFSPGPDRRDFTYEDAYEDGYEDATEDITEDITEDDTANYVGPTRRRSSGPSRRGASSRTTTWSSGPTTTWSPPATRTRR